MFNSNKSNTININNTKEDKMYNVTVLEYDDKRDYHFGGLGRLLNQRILGGRKGAEARRISKNKKNWKKNNPNIAGCI